MNELPIVVLEVDDNADVDLDKDWALHLGLTISARCDNLKRARKWVREQATPGRYLLVKKVEVMTVAYEQIETRVVR